MDTPPPPTVVQSEKPASDTPPPKPPAKSEKDSTKAASLLVSIAALLVSGSSFYQAYLNRMYAEDINQPVLTTAMASEGLFFPKRGEKGEFGEIIANARVTNVGKMTATKVVEKSFSLSVGAFSDDCFKMAGYSPTKEKPKEILPGGSEIFSYIVSVQPKCRPEFSAADPVPTVNVTTQVTYSDKSGQDRHQELTLPITSKTWVSATMKQ